MNRCFPFVSLALLSFTGTLLAQDNGAVESHQAKLESQFDELDKDGDGQLSEEESREFSQKRLGRMRENGLKQGFPLARHEFITAGVAEREADERKDKEKPEDRQSRKEMRNAVRSDELEAPSEENSQPGSPTSGGRRISSAKSKFVRSLPVEYQARDKNGDGQIGLYEWDRAKYTEFAKLDKNGDGFLTPAELGPKIVPKAGGPQPGGDDQDPLEREARDNFSRLDGNRDGSLTEDEWAKSQRTRGMFEQASINVSLPVDAASFTTLYRKAREASSGGRGGDRR